MALKYVEGFEQDFDTKRFRELGEFVATAANRTIPEWKSVIGTNMFTHESGIHADGVIKNPKTYEAYAPEEVGLVCQIVVGKHSGSRSIELKFHEYGMDIPKDVATKMLPRVRTMAMELKRPLFDKELRQVYDEYMAAEGSAAE